MHVPVEVARRAGEVAASVDADGCVAVGGGSAIGLGKAVALERALPVVAVPTTYAGSEMTPVWGLTEDGVKRTGREPRVQPVAVVYDPALTLSMPPRADGDERHERARARGGGPVRARRLADHLADGRGGRAGLRRCSARPWPPTAPTSTPARRRCTGRGSAAASSASTTMGLHHKLCHVLGGTLGLPHAATHTVVLPYVLAFNAPAAPEASAALARALGALTTPLARSGTWPEASAPRARCASWGWPRATSGGWSTWPSRARTPTRGRSTRATWRPCCGLRGPASCPRTRRR